MSHHGQIDPHYSSTAITTTRSVPIESETYQQCSYQTFQMWVHTVVDPSNSDEIRLKHLQHISDNIEIFSALHNYINCVDLIVKNFLRYLTENETVFIIPSNAQTIRKQMIEVFHRLPITDALRNFVKDILSPMFKLLTKENEENALILLRIIVEYMKHYRPQMINEVRDFLQFVHNVYRQKASALDQMFITKKFDFPTMTIHEIDISNLLEQICSSVQLTVKKISSITTDEATNVNTPVQHDTLTILSHASHSVKLLADFPVAIVLLYQLCRQPLQNEFGDLVPLFLRYLVLTPNKEQRNDPKFNMEVYIEFLTTQAKTLSFLAFVAKTYQEPLTTHSDLLVMALIQLLDGCPAENVQLRKDVLAAARHFLSSEFRTFFIPSVKHFFDENRLISSGYTARETLKPLVYNTFGDFFHQIRTYLSIDDLQNVLYFYSKIIHDTSLPPSIQMMILRFLVNIAESIRQKNSEKSRELLLRSIEILIFKCKSLSKQYSHALNNSTEKNSSTTSLPPVVNEVDLNTCSLNELVQNLNDLTNREKEIQRQQFALIRFQSTSPLVYPLSAAEGRALLKILVTSLRQITCMLAEVKISTDNVLSQGKQFLPSITILYIKFFKYVLQCLMLFFDSSSTNSNSNLSRSKEEKEIMDVIASVFIVLHKQNYREIFQSNLEFFYNCATKNSNITSIISTLLQQSSSSTILVELLLEYLLPRIDEIGETNNSNNACLKLFKLVINSVVTTSSANENEKILQPYLKQIILRSIECAQSTSDPYNYFILLRALFRSIGMGNHELLNQEFLTLLHFLLQRLNEYQSCHHRQHLRELFIELCLTVPVRLSVLLPYLPLLMEPLVNALNGSSTLILQGLRTLELCVDNLQPDFLFNHILPVRSSLMISLYRLLSHTNNEIAQNTLRILGKLGGNNRRILHEAQQIRTNDEEEEEEEEIFLQMSLENETRSLSIPLLKLLRTCAEQLKSTLIEQQSLKRQCWLIIRSLLSIFISIDDDDDDFVKYFFSHSSFLHGEISSYRKLLKINDSLSSSRRAHLLLLQCLHQAAITKSLEREVLPILQSTIQHYTLVCLTYQTGPSIDEINENYSTILLDCFIHCYIDIDEELNFIGRKSFETFFQTLLILFDNDRHRLSKLPMIDYLVDELLKHCHDRMWFAKQGACRFLSQLCLNSFPNEQQWFDKNFFSILHGFFQVFISLTDEISSGTLEILSEMIENLFKHFSNENLLEQLVDLLLNYLFSPLDSIRQIIFRLFRQLSEQFHQTISRLIEPFKKDFLKKFSTSNFLPLKNQPLIYQITLLDVYIFFRNVEPKLSFLTLYDDELFKELTTFISTDDHELMKFSSYRSLTQQQALINIIRLKKLALKTLAEFYEQIDGRERVLRLFYKFLTILQSNELQTIVYQCLEKMFYGHQNDQIRLRFVDSYLQQISFHENEKFPLTLNVAQTLFFLSKLSPNSFDERLSDQISLIFRRLLQNIATPFRTNYDFQNVQYKIALIYLELLANLPHSSKRLIEQLTNFILKFNKHLMIESICSFRKTLIDLLIRHPQLSLDQFISDEHRFQDPIWSRLFLDLFKSNSSTTIQTFVRTNWLDRFRQILSDQIVSIETNETILPIICVTIRSLSILARNDRIWWSSQHELISLLLRLCRSNTFQSHSFLFSEHFDSFCSKEFNNVLNLCLIYYESHPERFRLLLELTRIYSFNEKLFYPKKFFQFIQQTIVQTYSFKWKKETLISFISLRSDESYSFECKSLFFEYILLPCFIFEFEQHQNDLTDEIFQLNSDETILDLFIRTMIDMKYLQQLSDKYRIALIRFLCLFLEYRPQLICDGTSTNNKRDGEKLRRLMECAYSTLMMNHIDPTYKCQSHLLLCYIISRYAIVKKIIVHVLNSLLKSFMIDAKHLIRQATDLLLPAIPIRIDDGYEILSLCTKRILSDDAHGNLQLIHILSIIVRHQTIFFHLRHHLAHLMIQSANKISGQQNNPFEQKKLAIDIVEVLIRWELRKHLEQIQDQKHFTRSVIDSLFIFLIRHACQINPTTLLPLSQQCIRLFKIARKFTWPNVDVKLITFERLIHQIESPNVTAHHSIAIAIDLLAFLISTFNVAQIRYTMRTLKRSLITCISITSHSRLVESMQNLFSKLIVQIPIELPTSTTLPTSNQPAALAQQLAQATLASLATAATPTLLNKNEDLEPFYNVITKTIIDNLNNTVTTTTTNENSRTTITPTNSTTSASTNLNSIHALAVAFGYLKIIEKHQPKYVDKLTPYITRLLQKLIKDHTSAANDYNPAFTEYIVECLNLLKHRIGQLTSDLRKQFMHNFLPCLIEKSHDINLVRSIIRLVSDWIKWRGDVQLVPSLKEKSLLLLRLLQCIDKSSRFQSSNGTNENDLNNSFLELILHVYQEQNYRELYGRLEAAFVLGLKSSNQQLRKQFFVILDKNLRKTLHDRLLFIFLSQNWEHLGQHYWIKQCLELFYSCASSTIPLRMIDERRASLPSLTSKIKSGEFYDRYDFLIDFVKSKNPTSIAPKKIDSPIVETIKMETNDETPAYSIISNALGVTAMSTLVTKKQRSTSISFNESKSKHFKRTISFENLQRFPSNFNEEKSKRTNENSLNNLLNDEISFLHQLSTIQSKPMDLYESILQFLHTSNSTSIDDLTHRLFIDLLPKILRLIPEKYRSILFQQVLQPFFISGTHLQQRDVYPHSSLKTLLEGFSSFFQSTNSTFEFVPLIRPIVLKYIGKTHNTWHRTILLLEEFLQQDKHDEIYFEAFNSLSELYEHLNEDDYNIALWFQRDLTPTIQPLIHEALKNEQLAFFPSALNFYTQAIKQVDQEKISLNSSSTSNRFFQLDEYAFLEQHWIKCTKELNQWETLTSFCKQQSNRDHLLYLDCAWKSSNWPLMKETLGQLDAMCNGTNMNLTNSSLQPFPFLNQNPTLTQSTIISNILTIKDFQWKFALYRCYLTLCSTMSNTDDPAIYQTTMNITDRLIDYCSLNALKEWKHLPNYVSNSHLNLLQASQRIIELQESAQILLNLQNNLNSSTSTNTSTSIISTTSNGSTSTPTTTTTNIRQTTNMHELKTIVKTWKSRLPLISDSLSFWNEIFTWRELQYMTISSQFDKDFNGSTVTTGGNTTTGQVLLGIHAIAQSITQLGKIARKHQMPNVSMEILSRIGTVIPSVPVVDSYQKIKQVIKCYLVFLPRLNPNEIFEIFDLIEQANTKYFNKDMMSEFYSLKALALAKLNRCDEAEKLFSCATQLSENTLPRVWIHWADFLVKNAEILNDDEAILICYLNACREVNETKARSILSKVFYFLWRDEKVSNQNKLSSCIERYANLIPVGHWLFWLPKLMNKILRNESSSAILAILSEVARVYPQAVYVQLKRSRMKLTLIDDENESIFTSTTNNDQNTLNLPIISKRQQALNNFDRLERILFEQNPTIVRTFEILLEQLKTINETLLEYTIRRLYQCQRRIYEDFYLKYFHLPTDVKEILQHLKDLFAKESIYVGFAQDFNEKILNENPIHRSLLSLISKWISFFEHRIDETESAIQHLHPTKYLQLLSFHSQISNEIQMPGELSHAPEANFYFRMNKIYPRIERIFKHERFFHRLTIRTHNGKMIRYLLSDNSRSIRFDEHYQWDSEENTIEFLQMINNVSIRKEKELLKRHCQLFMPHLSIYLPTFRLIEDQRSTINLIEIFNDRSMLTLRKFYQYEQNEPMKSFLEIQNEFVPNRSLLCQWTWKEYSNPTGYFSFRKIFTISIGFYSTLNFLFGLTMFNNNQLNIQRAIGNVNPIGLTLNPQATQREKNIYIGKNIENFITNLGKLGPFKATISATLLAFARPKYQLIEFLKIFYKEDFHLKNSKLNQNECVEKVEDFARQFEKQLEQFLDFDRSKIVIDQLIDKCTNIDELAQLNPLYYPWL